MAANKKTPNAPGSGGENTLRAEGAETLLSVEDQDVNEECEMAWVKLDENLPDDPRFLEFEDPTYMLGVYCQALTYTHRHLLDGKFPKVAVARWVRSNAGEVAEAFVRAGLWNDDGKNYVLVDYLAHGNQTKADMEATRAHDRERKARARAERKRPDRSDVQTESSRSPAGVPSLVFSDLISEGEGERERENPYPTREQDYQHAYELGISEGKGSPYAMPENQRGALHQGMLAHAFVQGKKVRGPELLSWITRQARQFAAWLVKQDPKTIAFHSSFGPRGWLQWLNATPIRKPTCQPTIANAPTRMPANDVTPSEASGGQPQSEDVASFNVAQLTATIARGFKP